MANTNSYNFITVNNADDLNEGGLHTTQRAPAHDPRDVDFPDREAVDLYVFASGNGEPRLPGEPPLKRRAVKDGTGFEVVPEDEAFGKVLDKSERAADGSHLAIVDFDEEDYHEDRGIGEYVEGLKENDDEIDAIVERGFGVYPELAGRMGSAEVTVKKRSENFDMIRPHLAALARTLALCMNYTEMDLDRRYNDPNVSYYKVMVVIHCAFMKLNSDGSREFRTFIFDQMAEDGDGHYYILISGESIYKAVYNTFLKLAYEKLDMRNVVNVPNMDSKFEFYAIRTAGATLFRFNPLSVGGNVVPTPPVIKASRCTFALESNEYCFRNSILLLLLKHKVEPERWSVVSRNIGKTGSLLKRVKEIGVDADFSMIPPVMPYNEKLLDEFSKANPDIFLCVWTPSGEGDQIPIRLIYQSPEGDIGSMVVCNVLLLTQTQPASPGQELENTVVDSHFIPIVNIDGLFSKISKNHTVHVCPVCLVRRLVINKGYGFCPTHETRAYLSAVAYAETHKNERPLANVPHMANLAESYIGEYITSNKLPTNLCVKCGNYFDNPLALEQHKVECIIKDNNYRIINLPKERTYLELKGSDRMKMANLHTAMTADFECILDPIQEQKGNILFESEHKPCGFTLVMESDFPALRKHTAYFGIDAQDTIEKFCETIIKWATEVHDYYMLHSNEEVHWKEGEKDKHDEATKCYLCGRTFDQSKKGMRKVCDHDHMTGEYLGAACDGCNINRRPDRQKIPLFFHNGKNYDTHLLIREVTKARYGCQFDGIPQNSQKFMTFTIMKIHNEVTVDDKGVEKIETKREMNDIQVLDSVLFLLSSLGSLTEIYKRKSRWDGCPETEEAMQGYKDVFPITYRWMYEMYKDVPNGDEVEPRQEPYNPRVTLALRKNAYPYRWFDSFDKFSLPISEMTKLFTENRYEAFTENITDGFKTDFEKKKKVYFEVIKQFNIRTVKDYALLYVRMDGLQLMDILQQIRAVYKKVHSFDMFQYFGLPSFSWATFIRRLEIHNFKPELFKEGEMDKVCFFRGAIRGGCSGIMLRHCKPNNKYMEDFDPSKPHSYCLYYDANNLYGWSMSQNLPEKNFQWVDEELYKPFEGDSEAFAAWLKERYSDEKNKGCYVMCDIYAPPEIHDKTAYYPLAPESGTVKEEQLSGYQREMHEHAGSKHDGKSPLLLQTLLPKRRYTVYYKNLLFYLKKGMRMRRAHKVMEFDEAKLMKPHIETNQNERVKANNDADKNAWKTLNNTSFGKTMEDQGNYSELRFISTTKEFNNAVRDPGFNGYAFHSDNLMIGKMKHTSYTFNKPIYLGATITELAKLHMYEFYYDVLCDHFGWENVHLCMTDTDSLLVEVVIPKEKTDANEDWDIYDEIKEIQEKYDCPIDTSAFSRDVVEEKGIRGDHNKEIGYFKSEIGSSIMSEFVGLRAKCYSYTIQDDPEGHMRCKGTPKDALELSIRHNNYLQCIWHNNMPENIRQHVDFSKIQSKEHQIYSLSTSKVSLSCNDSKRFILEDNIHTLPYGHYAIPQYRKYYERHEDLLPNENLAYYIKDIKRLPFKDFSEISSQDIEKDEDDVMEEN